MKIIRYTSTFKPEGKAYAAIALWNRYMRSKMLLLATFLPTIAAVYFLITDPGTPFWWIFVIIVFYPLYSLAAFLLKIKSHLKFRSPMDIAETEYTFMNNGILIERRSVEKLDMMHWEDANLLYELKDFLVLFKGDTLVLVFMKKDMADGQLESIKDFIIKHLSSSKGSVYKKTLFF